MSKRLIMPADEQRAYCDLSKALWNIARDDTRARGAAWYPEGCKILAENADRLALPRETLCAATAALSQRLRWEYNLPASLHLAAGDYSLVGGKVRIHGPHGFTYPTLPMAASKALRILHGCLGLEGLAGGYRLKTGAFGTHLLNPSDNTRATIDTWMLALAGYPTSTRYTKTWYAFIERALITAAYELGVDVSTLQATLWILARDVFQLDTGERFELIDGDLHVHRLDGLYRVLPSERAYALEIAA